MVTSQNMWRVVDESLAFSQQHYENFPVASILLPKHLRYPVSLIYTFARRADDFADEGSFSPQQRLAWLADFKAQLDLIRDHKPIESDFFKALAVMIQQHQLPLQPFDDLLDAFSQDVVKARYENFSEVMHYCERSANPVGRLLLHLYKQATPENVAYADQICSALQLINFYQDIAIDLKKDRIYLCQDEMRHYGITESQLMAETSDKPWQAFFEFNLQRAQSMLASGKPLGRILRGRIGLEMRLIIAGGERIIAKLYDCEGDVFRYRPQLRALDWPLMGYHALLG
jgi:squalene synthase HpnC